MKQRITQGEAAFQLLYASGTDTAYVVRQTGLEPLGQKGVFLRFPKVTPTVPEEEATPLIGLVSGVAVDVEPQGRFAYYADRIGRTIYKMSIPDGKTIAARHLTFAPTAVFVDKTARFLYVLDWAKGNIVTVKAF